MDEDSLRRVKAKSLKAKSLKARCGAVLERLLISGELAAGDSLPPERELALRLGVSRPLVHEAIVELAARGFLAIEPRHGVKVRDFWREGTLSTFEAIVLEGDGEFPHGLLEDVLAFRALIELEAVRLAAKRRGGEYLARLEELLEEEEALSARPAGIHLRAKVDLRFHQLLADASGNRVLPLVMGSIAPISLSMIERFYRARPDLSAVSGYHRRIVRAIAAGRAPEAARIASEMLEQGAALLGAAPPSPSLTRRPR
jgi:GntR family transcriptional regulator, transcriptional repressor for pyruvate dehydrogenase complex